MFNIIERVKDFAQRKECTDLLLRSWKKENEDVYADFVKRIDRIKDGDINVVEEMMALACQCCPPELHAFHQWLGDYCKGRIDTTDIPAQIQKWAGEHVDIIVECLTRKQLWVGVNLKTGEVRLMAWKKKDYLMVHSETPKELWERLSEDVRANIVGQVDMALKKEYHQVSKAERAMTYHAIAFCAKLVFLTYAASAGRFLANLYDLVIERKSHLPFCMYYFVGFSEFITNCVSDRLYLLIRLAQQTRTKNHEKISNEIRFGADCHFQGCNQTILQRSLFSAFSYVGRWFLSTLSLRISSFKGIIQRQVLLMYDILSSLNKTVNLVRFVSINRTNPNIWLQTAPRLGAKFTPCALPT